MDSSNKPSFGSGSFIGSFLRCGSLVSVDHERILIGYGERTWHSEPTNLSFYFPTFFLNDQTPWFRHEHMLEISREDLCSAITFGHPADIPRARDWETTPREVYRQIVHELGQLFDAKILVKAVPYIRSRSSPGLSREQLLRSLQSVLTAGGKHPVYLYGFWDSASGILGATPELLFRMQGMSSIETMACAGTCRRGTDEAFFVRSPKEQREHQLVVDDIASTLSAYGKITMHKQEVRAYNRLAHLVTPITLEMEEPASYEDIVRVLHPTAALGAHPRAAGSKWLMDFDRKIEGRGRYGAPAGFVREGKGVCLVAIRNMQWNAEQAVIYSGSGVVPESSMEGEWNEVLLKLESIKELVGV